MPGDVVRRMIKGKDTQRGYCRDVELTACVQVIGTKQILTDIKSEDLIPLQVHRYLCDRQYCVIYILKHTAVICRNLRQIWRCAWTRG